MEVPPEAIEGEHDLEWLVKNEFDPTGTVLFAQYFTSSADNNAEIVVCIIHHVDACEDVAANQSAVDNIQAKANIVAID
jgi:hypothetical protein